MQNHKFPYSSFENCVGCYEIHLNACSSQYPLIDQNLKKNYSPLKTNVLDFIQEFIQTKSNIFVLSRLQLFSFSFIKQFFRVSGNELRKMKWIPMKERVEPRVSENVSRFWKRTKPPQFYVFILSQNKFNHGLLLHCMFLVV